MEVTTSSQITYKASYDEGKLVKVIIDHFTITDNPDEFSINAIEAGFHMVNNIPEFLVSTRNKCREWYNDNDVMKFVCDNIKKILNTNYGLQENYQRSDETPYNGYTSVTRCELDNNLSVHIGEDFIHYHIGNDTLKYSKEFVNQAYLNNTHVCDFPDDKSWEFIQNTIDKMCPSVLMTDAKWEGFIRKSIKLLQYYNKYEYVKKSSDVITKLYVNDRGLYNDKKKYNGVINLMSPPTLMASDKYAIYKEEDLTIKVDLNDKDIAWLNDKPIEQFSLYDYGKLDYVLQRLQTSFKPVATKELLRNFKTRLTYLVHVKMHNDCKLSRFDAIMDGRILIMNIKGNPSIDELQDIHDRVFKSNPHAIFQADFVAYKYELGYYIAKNKFGEHNVMTTNLHVSMILDRNYK